MCFQFTASLGKVLADQASGGSISSSSPEIMMAMDRKKRRTSRISGFAEIQGPLLAEMIEVT
jgi:hypothetical protein